MSSSNTLTLDTLLSANPVVPVVVVDSADDGVQVGQALVAGGITTAEVTFRTAAAASAIAAMQEVDNLVVGAGTVINVEQAKAALDAGAKYIVSPGFSAEIVSFCQDAGVPVLPAATDASRIMEALAMGINTIKFFPAVPSGGLPAIKALSAPFPGLRFVPTGGVSANNLDSFLIVPAVAACGGSWMVKTELIRNGRWERITELSAQAVQIAQGAGR